MEYLEDIDVSFDQYYDHFPTINSETAKDPFLEIYLLLKETNLFSNRELVVFYRKYYCEYTDAEIANILHVSGSYVFQIRKSIIEKIKKNNELATEIAAIYYQDRGYSVPKTKKNYLY